MAFFYYLIPLLIGLLDGIIQNPHNRTTLHSRLMLVLITSTLIALIPGWRLCSREIIDIDKFYLLLINAGTAAGVLILLERLLIKSWWWILISGILIGLISIVIVRRHVVQFDQIAFWLGMLVSGGYLLGGLILKTWHKHE